GRAALRAALTIATRRNTANPYGLGTRVENINQGKAAALPYRITPPRRFPFRNPQSEFRTYLGRPPVAVRKSQITKRTQFFGSEPNLDTAMEK
ncbi:MAG TPA: hypothetical protein VL527_07175, partial [Dongiaceae bacterium]|nr:hypothetical protein [Dongiaceae bacterium]